MGRLTRKLAFILLDGHVYRVVGWVQINQKLVLSQLLESSRTSGSECLSSEGQTQERRRFYNGSVKQRRAPKFTGEGTRYVTVIQTLIWKSDLIAGQVTLDPSMEVSHY